MRRLPEGESLMRLFTATIATETYTFSPMATTIEECQEIVELVKKTGLTYMMAETVVYSREFLFIKELYDQGELGKIQFLQASHQQDMDGWPNYWPGLPPMWYATHCVGPMLALTNATAEYVSCFGSGTVRKDIAKKSGNKFAVETCHCPPAPVAPARDAAGPANGRNADFIAPRFIGHLGRRPVCVHPGRRPGLQSPRRARSTWPAGPPCGYRAARPRRVKRRDRVLPRGIRRGGLRGATASRPPSPWVAATTCWRSTPWPCWQSSPPPSSSRTGR